MKFCLLFGILLFVSASAFAGEDVQTVLADYRAFSKMVTRVLHEEPTLVQNSNFDQRLTLKYQRYANSQDATQLRMIFSVAPGGVKLDQFAKVYAKYGKELTSLSDELPIYVRGHIAMITDADYAAKYRRHYAEVEKTIFTAADGKLAEFKVFDCDYTTQPTNALWYLEHSLELLDRYATALYGEAWETKREELRQKNQIRTPAEVRGAFEAGLKEIDAKQPSGAGGESAGGISAD